MPENTLPPERVFSNQQTEADLQAKIAELDSIDPENPGDEEAADDQVNDDPGDQKTNADDTQEEDDAHADDEDDSDDEVEDKPDNKVPPKKEDATEDDKSGKDGIDYKTRYSDSSAEARILAERNRVYEEAIEEAENLPEPTDDECRAEYGEAWDDKDDMDKSLARQVLQDKRYKDKVRNIRKQQKADQQYYEKVQAFAVDPNNIKDYPFLEGNETAFADFASKPTRRDLDLDFVASVFGTTRHAKKKSKGEMIPTSHTSQTKSKPKPAKIDASKMKVLRQVDQKTYQELVRTGKINPADLLE